MDYFEITQTERSDLLKKSICFKDYEKKSINKIVERWSNSKKIQINLDDLYNQSFGSNIKFEYFRLKQLYINVIPDEWFLIRYQSSVVYGSLKFYKCDQLYGLIEFLKNEVVDII